MSISYETAKQIKELGLTQKRHKNAKYYVTPSIIMDFEAIHDLKDAKAWFEKRFEEEVNWMDNFTYIPELIDLIGVQTYDLTLDAAVYHFIEGKKSHKEDQQDLLKRNDEAFLQKPQINEVKTESKTLDTKDIKTVNIADSTYEGIEKIKEAIHATQSPSTTI